MILMDSGLHTLHDVLDKGNSRHQSIGTNHLFMLPYVSDATDHIPDSETDMTLP
jgi:hypothetical protein